MSAGYLDFLSSIAAPWGLVIFLVGAALRLWRRSQRAEALLASHSSAKDANVGKEAQLAQSAQLAHLTQLAQLAERTTSALALIGADGCVTWINDAFVQVIGFSPEQTLGQSLADLVLGPHAANAQRELWLSALRGEVIGQRFQFAQGSGQPFWVFVKFSPLKSSPESLATHLVVLSDITEQVQASAALVIEKQRTEELLAGANIGTWECNVRTGEFLINARWAEMLGYSVDSVGNDLQAFFFGHVHPDDRVRLDNLEVAFRAGRSEDYACQLRLLRQDGAWIWVLRRANVISRLADGHIEWMGGIHTDISEFKAVEMSLRSMESFLDRAGRLAGVGGWQIDLRDGSIIFADQTCLLHGLEPGTVLTREAMLDFYPAADRARLEAAMESALEMGAAWDLELEFVDRNGAHLWVRQFGEVEFDDTGAVRMVGAFQDITEDKKTRLQVERSGEMLRAAIDALNEAFVLFDADERLVFCNDKYREVYANSADLLQDGASFESILRGNAARGRYPEAAGRVEEWVQQRLARFRHGDSTSEQQLDNGRWLKVIDRRMPDGHTVGFRVDITEIRMATAQAQSVSVALADERRRLRTILEGTRVGTWEWNVATGELLCNDQYQSLLGYPPVRLDSGGYAFLDSLIHPLDADDAALKMQAHLRGETPLFEHEMRLRHADGRWIWLLARANLARRTHDGQPHWVYGTHTDISERKRAEMRLAETSATLQNVLDSATQVGLITLDREHVIQIFNRGAERLLGYAAQQLVGQQSFSEFFEASELAALSESLALVIGETPTETEVLTHIVGQRDQQEWTFVRQDGARFICQLIFSPLLNQSGELTGHLAVIYDVSEQKEYETSLRQAMHLAEQSSVAKSQFLANMSHEIRTPMNAVLGMLQLLQRTDLAPRQSDYVEKAQSAARSLLSLLNDILDFSKVEAGKMQLDPQPFQLETLLGDLSVILSSNLGAKEVDLLFDIDPAIPPVLLGDSLRLQQILINLGGNAVKFTEAGEVRIALTLHGRTADRAQIGVAVHDSGIGIAPENQARIFEAFTQAESNTTRRFGGTGLGLVISTRLIGLMGSELALSSTLGVGSVFSFILELPIVADTQSKVAASDARMPQVRALLVDDNIHARETAAKAMQSLGWDLALAQSGAQAMALAASALNAQTPQERDLHRPVWDAVFIDWHMPEMNGAATLQALQELLQGQALPLFIMVGRQGRDALKRRAEATPLHWNGWMVRPLTAAMFAQALATARRPVATQASDADGVFAQRALQSMRLLLVEDNSINQQVAKELLEGVGADVTLADNGQLGLDALTQSAAPFDAVLMDLQMPIMDGLTATRRIRSISRFAKLPVIAMTANAMAGDRELCLAAGMNDHIGKPFNLDDLIRVLVRHTGWALPAVSAASGAERQALQTAPLAGVDWDTALARMGGNQGLLGRSLRGFCADVASAQLRWSDQLTHAQWGALQRELHTFKGLAATLGLQAVSAQAAQAERHAKTCAARGDPVHPTDRRELAQSIHALATSVDGVLPSAVAFAEQLMGALAPAATVANVANVTSVIAPDVLATTDAAQSTEWAVSDNAAQTLRQLHELLATSDMRAMEVHALLPSVMPAHWLDRLAPLDAAMSHLEFEEAAEICRGLMAQSGLV